MRNVQGLSKLLLTEGEHENAFKFSSISEFLRNPSFYFHVLLMGGRGPYSIFVIFQGNFGQSLIDITSLLWNE